METSHQTASEVQDSSQCLQTLRKQQEERLRKLQDLDKKLPRKKEVQSSFDKNDWEEEIRSIAQSLSVLSQVTQPKQVATMNPFLSIQSKAQLNTKQKLTH